MTIRELLQSINPLQSDEDDGLAFVHGTSRSVKKHLDMPVVVYWTNDFACVFGYINKIGKLHFYSASCPFPLADKHFLDKSALKMKTNIAVLDADVALEFLEEKNGQPYPDLRAIYEEKVGKLVGTIIIKRNVPKYNSDSRSTTPSLRIRLYDSKKGFRVYTTRFGETGMRECHDRKAHESEADDMPTRARVYDWRLMPLTPGVYDVPASLWSWRTSRAGQGNRYEKFIVESDMPPDGVEILEAMKVLSDL